MCKAGTIWGSIVGHAVLTLLNTDLQIFTDSRTVFGSRVER